MQKIETPEQIIRHELKTHWSNLTENQIICLVRAFKESNYIWLNRIRNQKTQQWKHTKEQTELITQNKLLDDLIGQLM
jgi:hypothetical protein